MAEIMIKFVGLPLYWQTWQSLYLKGRFHALYMKSLVTKKGIFLPDTYKLNCGNSVPLPLALCGDIWKTINSFSASQGICIVCILWSDLYFSLSSFLFSYLFFFTHTQTHVLQSCGICLCLLLCSYSSYLLSSSLYTQTHVLRSCLVVFLFVFLFSSFDSIFQVGRNKRNLLIWNLMSNWKAEFSDGDDHQILHD